MSRNHIDAAELVKNSVLILLFYISSIALTFYNKWMSKRFHFPLTVSMLHFVTVFFLAMLIRKVYEMYYKEKRIVLDWRTYVRKCFLTAISGSLDIGLSNWSIMLSTVSLYTMAKSSTIIFIVMFSVMLRLEKLDRYLFTVVVLISSGLFLFTLHNKQFNMLGFLMALAASLLGGIRWTTTQLIMQKKNLGISNPFDAIFHIQPVMALAMVGLVFSLEGQQLISSQLFFRAVSLDVVLSTCALILVGAFLAFFLTIAEYLLVSNTSSITLAISAIFKEICTLTLAAEFGGDKWTILNFIGLVICLMGITIHVLSKLLKEKEANMEQEVGIVLKPLMSAFDSDSDDVIFENKRRRRKKNADDCINLKT